MRLLLYIMISLSAFCLSAESKSVVHKVYFPKTDYELHIFKITGRDPGPTLMIMGGIQGDEPGAYISADMYADLKLKKGNLIVVPRANFVSIMGNKRQINKDMNRRFAKSEEDVYEDKVVSILKKLMAKADFLINLHEGSGFYSPKYKDETTNPQRFGQSVIADADVYHSPKCNCDLRLKDMAEKVIENANENIENKKYRFMFNNHSTASENTTHPEQRQSATYYALYTLGIPAFGVEVSKDIQDIDLKVGMHSLVVNSFMRELGIVPETPSINIAPPMLKYMVVKVNGRARILTNGDVLYIPKKATIEAKYIETNYPRGISVDVLNVGSINDYSKPVIVEQNTKIVVKKDAQVITEIPVKIYQKTGKILKRRT